MSMFGTEVFCAGCGTKHPESTEARLVRLDSDGVLVIRAGQRKPFWSGEVSACGQRCTLILVERYLERGTLEPLPLSPAFTAEPFSDLT